MFRSSIAAITTITSTLLLTLLSVGSTARADGTTSPQLCTLSDSVDRGRLTLQRAGNLLISLPRELERDPDRERTFPRGGFAWKSSTRRIEIVDGHWDGSSLPENGARCILVANGRTVHVSILDLPDGVSIVAWTEADRSGLGKLFTARGSSPGDRDLFLAALGTARWRTRK